MPRQLYRREKSPRYWIGGWVGPRAGLEDVEKILDPIVTRTPTHPARSQWLYRLRNPEKNKCFNRIVGEITNNTGLGPGIPVSKNSSLQCDVNSNT
jgi:hypothetical protein